MTWLATTFGDRFSRRFLLAIACSIALHEIVAVLVPPFLKTAPEPKEVVEHVTIAKLVTPTPSPTPQPTPKATPRVISLNVNEGKQAIKEPIKRVAENKVVPPKTIHTKPIWDTVPIKAGQGAGAGDRQGAGSLGNGGNGTGSGNAGTGGGAGPCGAVDFQARGLATFNDTTGMYERNNVAAIIHFADGTAQTITLDWTWRYRSEDVDPFKNADAPMLFQFPPVAQRASEPTLVQYIMRYSRLTGNTLLNDQCPNIPAAPTPQPTNNP